MTLMPRRSWDTMLSTSCWLSGYASKVILACRLVVASGVIAQVFLNKTHEAAGERRVRVQWIVEAGFDQQAGKAAGCALQRVRNEGNRWRDCATDISDSLCNTGGH